MTDTLTLAEARRLFLLRQGLLRDQQFGRGYAGSHKAALGIGWLQIDTISVVERAHHHVLRTRVPGYRPEHLHRMQFEDRSLFEYWAHAAAYLPMEEYRFTLPLMAGSAEKRKPERKLARQIIERIRNEGPLSARDFEAPKGHKSGGWWDWKPAKVCLEYLYLSGELMVCHRDKFQKVYDLPENIIPDHIDLQRPTESEWLDHMVLKLADAKGVVNRYDVGYQAGAVRQLTGRGVSKQLDQSVARLLEAGTLIPVQVNEAPYFARPQHLAELPLRLGRRRVRFLSPFDNLVINRRRAQALFDFDYLLECYVPEPKRKYGYFALPILFGDRLIGRLDAKAERKTRCLRLKNLVIDQDSTIDDDLLKAMNTALKQFRDDNDCDTIELERCSHRVLKEKLDAS